jgi:putative hydroxymethylpyrimidine transport system substrate-binding protein
MVRRVLWAAGAVVVLAAVGVGLYLGMRPTPAGRPIQVVLDFFPNPNHVPLYLAAEDPESGIEILVPANPSDPVRLAASRTVDVALTPQTNYLMARAEGLPLVAIGALIDHTLGGLLALAPQGTLSVADLAGRRIG